MSRRRNTADARSTEGLLWPCLEACAADEAGEEGGTAQTRTQIDSSERELRGVEAGSCRSR